jgi:hypothetical protein
MPVDYALWQYVHILLFVYWLGADLGVFLAARYVARADLPLAERLRFLDLLLKIDMGPRTALILMVPVGATLALKLGVADFLAGWLPLAWLASMAWLALAWLVALRPQHTSAAIWTSIDRAVRVAVATGFVAVGATSLLTGAPVFAPWLAVKLLLFGGVVTLGLLLRGVLRDWAAGFGSLRHAADGDSVAAAAANARIAAAQARATPYAMLLWLLVAAIAFLGVAKPVLGAP